MARPIWTGSIIFGLVNIPVELNVAVHERTVHFHMLTKDGTCRLRRKLVCPETGKEYDFSQTAKGIEVGPDDYVLVDQKEIDRLKPEKGRALDIDQFVDVSAIDPIYFDRVYYLKPASDGKKAYKLLVDAMAASSKCAIGHFVMREKQYLVAIRTMKQMLVLHSLHYADEISHIDEEVSDSLKKVKVSSTELRMANDLIKSMTKDLHLEKFKDEFREQLLALIHAEAKGKKVSHPSDEEEHPRMKTINLMDALKKSLASGSTSHNGHRRRRSA
jgi:DNA end-binding protein Ku